MSEKPILFSRAMVRAILDGAKTQTRRLVTPGSSALGSGSWDGLRLDEARVDRCQYLHAPREDAVHRVYPRIEPGDTLWVRETWRVGGMRDPVFPHYEDRGDVARSPGKVAIDYAASSDLVRTPWCVPPAEVYSRLSAQVCARAAARGVTSWGHGESPDRWRSPIHMPRWASRLTLRVTDVRVERLGDISAEDCVAEGAMHWLASEHPGRPYRHVTPRAAFGLLWLHVHGDGAWERDRERWVWVYGFEVEGRDA